jgi:hypothetical protein
MNGPRLGGLVEHAGLIRADRSIGELVSVMA